MSAQLAQPAADATEQIGEYSAEMRAEEIGARIAVDGGYWRRVGGHVVADEDLPEREDWYA